MSRSPASRIVSQGFRNPETHWSAPNAFECPLGVPQETRDGAEKKQWPELAYRRWLHDTGMGPEVMPPRLAELKKNRRPK